MDKARHTIVHKNHFDNNNTRPGLVCTLLNIVHIPHRSHCLYNHLSMTKLLKHAQKCLILKT